MQSTLQQCCCDNRAGIADLKYTVATENCADRAALSDALRSVIEANTASTQRILDQMCADKIDAKNDTIAQLRQELLYARGQASQDVQTATIRAGQATTANQLIAEMRACPVPSMPVYGMTPILYGNQLQQGIYSAQRRKRNCNAARHCKQSERMFCALPGDFQWQHCTSGDGDSGAAYIACNRD